jgi:hypothetical protein
MGAHIGQGTLDVRDVATTARFWAAALGYRVDGDGQHLRPPPEAGQSGTEGFVVLADPEGNEFCVLHGRRPG